MREIKFRGVDVENNSFVFGKLVFNNVIKTSEKVFEFGGQYSHDKTEDIKVDYKTIGQFTGFKDSKGVEIYEGDILQYTEELEGEYICGQKDWFLKVIWENDGWYLLSGCETVGGKPEEFNDYLEVIGNIHENGDLLK